MKFVNFEGFQKDKITMEICVGGIALDLHNEWNLVGYSYHLPSACLTMQWQSEAHPDLICCFEFGGVKSVGIGPRDPDYPQEEGRIVSDILYQEVKDKLPSLKFWFEDESTIEIAADQLTLDLAPQSVHTDRKVIQ